MWRHRCVCRNYSHPPCGCSVPVALYWRRGIPVWKTQPWSWHGPGRVGQSLSSPGTALTGSAAQLLPAQEELRLRAVLDPVLLGNCATAALWALAAPESSSCRVPSPGSRSWVTQETLWHLASAAFGNGFMRWFFRIR